MATFSYSVKFVCGVNRADDACLVRRGIYATDINIHNFNLKQKASVKKFVYHLVRDGKAVGREPAFVKQEPFDRIDLPPLTATMDDCCNLKLPAGVLSIGFLELISNVQLNVTAVYTASDLESKSVSIDVETVTGRKVA